MLPMLAQGHLIPFLALAKEIHNKKASKSPSPPLLSVEKSRP